MFEAVIFDCDGVLVDSEVLALEVELGSLAEIGLTYDEEDFKARFMGMSTQAFYDALDADHHTRLGRNLPEGFRDLCSARYRAAWHRLGEVPGAREAVAKVTHLKAVASSSSDEALNRRAQADRTLGTVRAACLFGRACAAIQARARSVSPCSPTRSKSRPEHCLVIEDSGNGVRCPRQPA